MTSPMLKPVSSASCTRAEGSPETELPNEHELVTALRDILANPKQHTVGGLAEVVLHSLAELSLLKDRLDMISPKTDSTPRAPSGSDPVGEAGAAAHKG
jgi:hypothetical protein